MQLPFAVAVFQRNQVAFAVVIVEKLHVAHFLFLVHAHADDLPRAQLQGFQVDGALLLKRLHAFGVHAQPRQNQLQRVARLHFGIVPIAACIGARLQFGRGQLLLERAGDRGRARRLNGTVNPRARQHAQKAACHPITLFHVKS